MSDISVDIGYKRNPNDFLAPMANESTALLILTYAIVAYVVVVTFKISYL